MFKLIKKSLILLLVSIFLLGNQAVFVAIAADLPQGLHNTNMTASVVGNVMTVNAMAAANTYGDWTSYDIGATSSVTYNQINSESISLNRVVGVNPSTILGTLTANGQVFLINLNGVIFGQNATLDVSGLVASTLDISNTDFLAGDYVFEGDSGEGVVNYGKLSSKAGGYIVLLGNTARNNGVIVAPLGKIVLAAGEQVTLGLDSGSLISVAIDKQVTQNLYSVADAVKNTGTLKADGGQIILTAKVLDGIFDNAINNAGIIEARQLNLQKGKVSLLADKDIVVAGKINVDGDVKVVSQDGDVTHQLALVTNHGLIGHIYTHGGDFQGYAGGDYIVNNRTSIDSEEGDLDIFAKNSIIIGSTSDKILTGPSLYSEETIFLTADQGAITQNAGSVSADSLAMSADKGISGPGKQDAMRVHTRNLSALNKSENNIIVKNDVTLNVEDLTGLTGLNSGVTGQKGVVNQAPGGKINLEAKPYFGTSDLNVNAVVQSVRGDITLASIGHINQNADITIINNSSPEFLPAPINLNSSSHTPGVRSLDDTVDVTWQVGDPTFETAPGNFKATAGKDYVMKPGVKIETNNGDADITARGDVKLTLVDADMGKVSVTAVNGSIIDNDLGTVPGDYDIIAHNIKLSAANGSVGGEGTGEQIDLGSPYVFSDPYDFSNVWVESASATPDIIPDTNYTSSLDDNGDWVFAQTSDELADSDNWWFHVATTDGIATSAKASTGPFVIGPEPIPGPEPTPTPTTRGYGDEYKDEFPVYYEILSPSQFLSFEPAQAIGLYAYHPLTPIDQSAFDSIQLDVDAYEFIDDKIEKKKEFSPYFGE